MSRIESFSRMFSPEKAHGEVITRVEIPLIQRDYAQGRRGEKVDEIRRNFLSVLRGAVSGGDARPVSLDFVYGERLPDGTLQPLDGQQRLTTLFLLHWYLASRSGNLSDTAEWTNFTYETRPSARRFCQRLVASTPDADAGRLSDWVTGPVVVPVHVALRPDDQLDAGHARRDPGRVRRRGRTGSLGAIW